MNPRARMEGILAKQVDDDLIVYDISRHHAHHLNRTAAIVWRHANGERSIGDLSVILQLELDRAADEELVWCALDRLSVARLLEEPDPRSAEATGASRRQFVRKVGLAGALSLFLPVVTSIVVPTPVEAQSCPPPSFVPVADVTMSTSAVIVLSLFIISAVPPFAFSATSSNASVVTISINSSQLTLTSSAITGTSTVTVTLTACNGLASVVHPFTVTVS